MQSRVECRAESEKTTAERRAEQRREQMSDESSAETRAALRGDQNRGAKAQRCRGADVQRRKGENRQSFVQREKKRYTRRNAGEKRSYIGSARVRCARGDCSHAHTRRDAHLASLTQIIRAARAHLHKERVRAQHRLRGAPQPRSA